MIGFLPDIYPDELVYSWFSRYYVYTGYPNNRMALEDILYNRHCNPSKEFIGHLNPDMEQTIKRVYPIEELVLEHTMFPQYARFIDLAKKKEALYRLEHDFCDAHLLFSILPRSEEDKYLKYCPLCAAEDREKYGEAYWHRRHQIRNMHVCVRHKCRLINSQVTAKSEQTFTLDPAEIVVPDVTTESVMDSAELEFAAYMEQVFVSPMDLENETAVGMVLYQGLKEKNYISSTGKTRNTKQLADDMQIYYNRAGLNGIASMYQIQRTLLGSRSDFGIVCQIAFFLQIPIGNLVAPSLSKEQIRNVCPSQRKDAPEDWEVYDKEMLPVIEQAAESIYNGSANQHGRPGKVTERLLYKASGLLPHRLENMPRCREVLEKYKESYGETWARRLIWAYNVCMDENGREHVFWSDIRKRSGVKKEKADQAIPHLEKYADTETADAIKKLLE